MDRRREHRIVVEDFEVHLDGRWHAVLDISRSSFCLPRPLSVDLHYAPRQVRFRLADTCFDAQAWLHRLRPDRGIFGYWYAPTRGPLPMLTYAGSSDPDEDGLPSAAVAAL